MSDGNEIPKGACWMLIHRIVGQFVRVLNFCLLAFGRVRDDSRVRCSWCNDNEKRNGVYGIPFSGRFWLRTATNTWRMSWNFLSKSCGVSATASHEDGLVLHVALPPVSLWLTVPAPVAHWLSTSVFMARWNVRYGGHPGSTRYDDFELFNIRVHDYAIWWSLAKFDWGWSHKMPMWMDGNWHFLDTLLGEQRHSEETIDVRDVVIPMPEGAYPATVKLSVRRWKRSRWPATVVRRTASIDIPAGVPQAGKGENSWDCDEDALFGLSCEARTLDEAIAKTVGASLRGRTRRDGDAMVKYPPAHERVALYESRLAQQAAQ